MKRKTRVIQIDGFRGLILALFAVVCLAAGFIAFPGYVAMCIWNHFASLPPINLFQGVLLWAIVAMSFYLANGRKVAISFASPQELTDAEMNKLMERVRLHSQVKMLNAMMLKSVEESQKQAKDDSAQNSLQEVETKNIENSSHEEIKK